MTTAWDPKKFLISTEAREVRLKIGDAELPLRIRNLSWSRRNQIVSQCLKWDSTGNTAFDADAYVKECLKAMIVEAPWGITNDIFLAQVGGELGAALESLVPKAFSQGTISIEEVKKE